MKWYFGSDFLSRHLYEQHKQTKKTEKDLGLQRGKMKRRFLIFLLIVRQVSWMKKRVAAAAE